MKHRLSRRTFLTAAGLTLPLPWLESAQAAPRRGPMRYVFLYQPCGLYPPAWDPAADSLQGELPRMLRPFAPFRTRMTVVRDLWNNANQHAGNTTALLTGRQAQPDPATGRYAAAQSVDQIIADRIGAETRLRSLELGIDHAPSGYCAATSLPLGYGATVAWRTPLRPLPAEVRPLSVYERLFEDRSGTARARLHERRSALDLFRQEAQSLKREASVSDRHRVDEYLDAVRASERRIALALHPPRPDFVPPTRPGKADLVRPPVGVPRHRGEHVRMMIDLLTLALWTDSTRVATFMFGTEQCNVVFDFIDGINQPYHEGSSHHGGNKDKIEQFTRVGEFHAREVAHLLGRLDRIREGEGSILDNSLIVFGSALKDGAAHTCEDLPIALFGTLGGRFRPRGVVRTGKKTLVSAFHLTTLRHYGVTASDFSGNGVQPLDALA